MPLYRIDGKQPEVPADSWVAPSAAHDAGRQARYAAGLERVG